MIVDTALQEREAAGRPIRVGMVGAGATGRAIALQLGTPVPGIRLVGISTRTPAHGERAFREAGFPQWSCPQTAHEADAAIAGGLPVLTDDPSLLNKCENIDVIVEVTGTIEPAARVVLDAFDHGKHVVLVNAELDSLLGPILKAKADQAGVVITHTDGDEPGVAMTLLRYLRTTWTPPRRCGQYQRYGRLLSDSRYATSICRKIRSGCEESHFLCRLDEALDGSHSSCQRHGFSRRPPRHVWPGLRLCAGDRRTSAGRRRCSKPVWWTMHSARRRTRELLSLFMRIAAEEGPAGVLQNWRRSVLCFLHAFPSAAPPDRFDHRPRVIHRDATVAPIGGPVCEVVAVAKRDLKGRRAARRHRRLLHLWSYR